MFLLVVLLTVATAFVQRPSDVVKWSAQAAAPAAPGSVAQIRVVANVQPGWKLYAIDQPTGGPRPLTFAVSKESAFRVNPKQIEAPRASIKKQDENFAFDTKYYENEAAFTLPVTVPPGTAAGTSSPLRG